MRVSIIAIVLGAIATADFSAALPLDPVKVNGRDATAEVNACLDGSGGIDVALCKGFLSGRASALPLPVQQRDTDAVSGSPEAGCTDAGDGNIERRCYGKKRAPDDTDAGCTGAKPGSKCYGK